MPPFNKHRTQKHSKSTENPFNSQNFDFDFNINQTEDHFGKRTGKLYQQNSWSRNSEGFFDYKIYQLYNEQDSLTPQSKVKLLRKALKFNDSPEKSSSKTSKSSITEKEPQKINRQPTFQTGKNKLLPRESDFNLSFNSQQSLEVSRDQERPQGQSESKSSRNNLEPKVRKEPNFAGNIAEGKQKTNQNANQRFNQKYNQRPHQRPNQRLNLKSNLKPNLKVNQRSNLKSNQKLNLKANQKSNQRLNQRPIQKLKTKLKFKSNQQIQQNSEKRSLRKKQNVVYVETLLENQINRLKKLQRKQQSFERNQQKSKTKSSKKQKTSAERITKPIQNKNQINEQKTQIKSKAILQKKAIQQNPAENLKSRLNTLSKDQKFNKQKNVNKETKKIPLKQPKPKRQQFSSKFQRNRFLSEQNYENYESTNITSESLQNSRGKQKLDSMMSLSKISEIKQRGSGKRRSDKIQIDEGNMSQSMQQILAALQSDGQQQQQQLSQLNKAVINTNTNSSTRISQIGNFDSRLGYLRKNKQKNSGNEQTERQNRQTQRGNDRNLNPKKSKLQTELQSRKDKRLQMILSESIKKNAIQYHEGKEMERKNQENSKNNTKKISQTLKRNRAFEQLQTGDLLDLEKLENQKVKAEIEKERVNKKIKTNEDKKDVKITKKQHVGAKSKSQLEDKLTIDQENQFLKQEKKKILEEINQKIKEMEKNRKKKDKPDRLKPKDLQQNRYAISSLTQNLLKNNVNTKKNVQNQNRYPQRKRLPRLFFWCGQRPVYNRERQLVTIQTKEIHRLIGWDQSTSRGTLIGFDCQFKQNAYYQRFPIQPYQLFDFNGFDDTFQKLEIRLGKTNTNYIQYGGKIQIYQNEKLANLKEEIIILPNSGSFTLQNIGNETVVVQMILTKNKYSESN